jgi:membrane protein
MRIRRRLQLAAAWATSHWPGRIFIRTIAGVARVELFDRSMTIAAQLFTSVVPLLILGMVVLGQQHADQIADLIDMPQTTQRVLDDALASSDASSFGVLSSLMALISATSLARALTRAYGAVWTIPRVRSSLSDSWRWVVAVLMLTAFAVAVRLLTWLAGQSSFPHLATAVITACADTLVAVLLPWILLTGRLPIRRLVPGAVIFGLVMMAVYPAGAVYLPYALEASADRYGTIGVAFTYIGGLYIFSFCLLTAAVLGEAIAQDEGAVGRFIRATPPASAERVTLKEP